MGFGAIWGNNRLESNSKNGAMVSPPLYTCAAGLLAFVEKPLQKGLPAPVVVSTWGMPPKKKTRHWSPSRITGVLGALSPSQSIPFHQVEWLRVGLFTLLTISRRGKIVVKIA